MVASKTLMKIQIKEGESFDDHKRPLGWDRVWQQMLLVLACPTLCRYFWHLCEQQQKGTQKAETLLQIATYWRGMTGKFEKEMFVGLYPEKLALGLLNLITLLKTSLLVQCATQDLNAVDKMIGNVCRWE